MSWTLAAHDARQTRWEQIVEELEGTDSGAPDPEITWIPDQVAQEQARLSLIRNRETYEALAEL